MTYPKFGYSSLLFYISAFYSVSTHHQAWILVNFALPLLSFLSNEHPNSYQLLQMDYSTIFLLGFIYNDYPVWLGLLYLFELLVCQSIYYSKNISFLLLIFKVMYEDQDNFLYYVSLVCFSLSVYFLRVHCYYRVHTVLWHLGCTSLLCMASLNMIRNG